MADLVSYENKSAPGAIRGELIKRLQAAGFNAKEGYWPRTGMPCVMIGDVRLRHAAFSVMGTFLPKGQSLPVRIECCSEVFRHGEVYDINDFDWDRIVELISGYVRDTSP